MTLDLRPVSRQLDELHQRFIDEGLPEELKRTAFSDFKPYAYDAAEVARGKAAWQNRVLELQTDLITAARFLADLAEMGTSADIQGLGTRLVRDRERHVEVCHRMVVALGGSHSIPGKLKVPRKPPGEVILRVLWVCVSELTFCASIQMRIAAEMGKVTMEPLAKSAINYIAADTAVHSRLGWQMLQVVAPALEEGELKELQRMLPDAFRLAEARHRPPSMPPGTKPGGPTHPFGSLDAGTRKRVYTESIDTIIQRLEKLGLPGQRAWQKSRQR